MKFTCDEIQDRWPGYIYRELPESDQALFVDHLQHCPRCREEEIVWRKMLDRFYAIAALDGEVETPPELIYRVKRQIRLYDDWTSQIFIRLRHWGIGAAAACVLLTGTAVIGINQWAGSPKILDPIQHSVLTSLYDDDTLDLLQDQDIIDNQVTPVPSPLANETQRPSGSESETDKGASPPSG